MSDNLYAWDLDNPHCVVNRLPPKLRLRVIGFEQLPTLASMDEESLATIVKPRKTAKLLRLAFWVEYNRAEDTGQKMQTRLIYRGICSKMNFYKTYASSEKKFAWIMKPPEQYAYALEQLVLDSMQPLKEIISFPLAKKNGCLNRRNAKLIMDAVTLLFCLENHCHDCHSVAAF